MKKPLLFIFGFSLLISACQKNEPKKETPTPNVSAATAISIDRQRPLADTTEVIWSTNTSVSFGDAPPHTWEFGVEAKRDRVPPAVRGRSEAPATGLASTEDEPLEQFATKVKT